MSEKQKDPCDHLIKIIVIGDSNVGKTNMILSYVGEEFKTNYTATIGVDFKLKVIKLNDSKLKLQIWDTAGQERFKTITETYYKGAAGIIMVYSVADRATFDNMGIELETQKNGWGKLTKRFLKV